MENKQLKEADILLRRCLTGIEKTSLLEMKYRKFESVRNDLYSALKLMDVEVTEIKPRRHVSPSLLFEIFDTNYPEWRIRRRKRIYVIPRHMLQYFLANRTTLSLSDIGRLTGGFDHTTVINSRNEVKNMLDTDQHEYVLIFNEVNKILKDSIETFEIEKI